MKKSINKLNITNKFAPIVCGGVLLLTGCGTEKLNNDVTGINSANASVINTEDETFVVITGDINNIKNNTVTTTTTIPEDEVIESTTKYIKDTTSEKVTDTTNGTLADTIFTTTVDLEGDSIDALYKELENRLVDIMGEYNTYSYVDTFDEYKVNQDDTLKSIADKFNTSVGCLIEDNNLTDDKVFDGQIIKYRVKDEYINVKAGNDISGIAISHGIPIEDVLKLNNIPSYNCDTPIKKDAAIKLHRYIGNERSYDTNIGVVNVIYDNRILGEEVEFAHGFAGSSQLLLVKNSSLNGTSAATSYSFDGAKNIIDYNMICINPKKIESIDGIPVAYLRTSDDLEKLADAYGIELDDISNLQWESVNLENYPVHITEDGEQFITFDGRILSGYNLISNKVLTR